MSNTDPDLKPTQGNKPTALDVVDGNLIVKRANGRTESWPIGAGAPNVTDIKTSTYTAEDTDRYILADATPDGVMIILPPFAAVGTVITVIRVDDAYLQTVSVAGTFDGNGGQPHHMYQRGSCDFVMGADSTWYVASGDIDLRRADVENPSWMAENPGVVALVNGIFTVEPLPASIPNRMLNIQQDYAVNVVDRYLIVDTSYHDVDITIALPSLSSAPWNEGNRVLTISKADDHPYNVLVVANGSNTISQQALIGTTVTLAAQGDNVTLLIPDGGGGNWKLLGTAAVS